MATFIGFSTVNQNKKFTLIDMNLIKRDLINAFNIQQGQLVGRPGYGTTIWNNIFENQTQETIQTVTTEIQRVAGGDPRIFISNIEVFPQQNGLLIQLEIQFVQGQTAELLSVFFDQQSRRATFV